MGAPRLRAAIEYRIDGDLRYLSHHDEIRVLMRALVRAAWPLAYSEGFNPQPRMSLPLPRRVGTVSLSQWAIVELDITDGEARGQAPPGAGWLFDAIARSAPPTIPIRGVTSPLPAGTPHPLRASYEIDLDSPDATVIGPRVPQILNLAKLVVLRTAGPGKPVREIDVRPLLEKLVLDGTTLRLRLAFDGQRTARPIEILSALGLPAADYEHRVRQTEIHWDMELAGPNRWPAAPERNPFVKEEDHNRGPQAAFA
jgi:radical SAM-linked protein